MFTAWDDRATADQVLRDALVEAVEDLSPRSAPWATLREEELRSATFQALSRRLPGRVRKERLVRIKAFRGVGGSDLLIDRVPGQRIAWLAETKWSYGQPPKVFEAVWDAIKLCLQMREHRVARGWLIVGAADAAWRIAEGRELFTSSVTDTVALWNQPLQPPRSPNYGKTIGEDLVRGGNGNQPTTVPQAIHTELVAEIPLPGTEPWTIRAVAVEPDEQWVADFAPAPKFPSPVTAAWLRDNVARMDEPTFDEFLVYLRAKRWTPAEIADRVLPLRNGQPPSR
jgi:hypothetical protein